MKEQRKYLRFPIHAIADLFYAQKLTCITHTININRGGIGLYSTIPVAQGLKVRIKIRFKDIWQHDTVEILSGEIVHCHEWHLVYVLGVKFEYPLNYRDTPGLAQYIERCERLYYQHCTPVSEKTAFPSLRP